MGFTMKQTMEQASQVSLGSGKVTSDRENYKLPPLIHPSTETTATKTVTSRNGAIQIDSREPDWESLPVLNGTNCMHEILSNSNELLEALKGPLPLGKEFRMKLKIAPKPFSNEGVSRYPFHAIWLNAPAGKGIQEERRVVLKEFKYDRGYVKWIGKIDYRDRSQYLVQGEVQTAASVMAQKFNNDIRFIKRICPSVQEIRFPQVRVVSVQHSLSKEKYYNMEPLLQSTDGSTLDFVRFTNNNGAIGKQGLNHEFSDTVLAFSHYTYQKTKGRLMVTDLQGCWCRTPRGEKQFTLSDPMIHSDEFFMRAAGNFGKQGAAAFFKSHKCNDVCRALGLFPVREFDAASGTTTSSRSAVSSISTASTSTAASSASSPLLDEASSTRSPQNGNGASFDSSQVQRCLDKITELQVQLKEAERELCACQKREAVAVKGCGLALKEAEEARLKLRRSENHNAELQGELCACQVREAEAVVGFPIALKEAEEARVKLRWSESHIAYLQEELCACQQREAEAVEGCSIALKEAEEARLKLQRSEYHIAELQGELDKRRAKPGAFAGLGAEDLHSLAKELEAAASAARTEAVATAEGAGLCPVCWTARKDMAFQCGHQTCAECGKRLNVCPICRSDITLRIQLF